METFINNLKNFSNGNEELAKFILVLIASMFLLLIPIFVTTIFPLFKSKLSPRGNALLYSFVTGFFIILATFGFLRESLEISSINGYDFRLKHPKLTVYTWNIILVCGGLITGLLFAFGLRKTIKAISRTRVKNDKFAAIFIHNHEIAHDHGAMHDELKLGPDHKTKIDKQHQVNDPKLKVVALLLILAHRIPAGILIGYNLNQLFYGEGSSLSIAFLISFILHLIPEEIIYYYRQREMGISRWKAMLISIGIILLFIPLMLIGIYFGHVITSIWQVRSFISAVVAGIFLFTSIVEFLPEFFHSHHDKKLFRWVMLMFFIGIVLCALVLSFHEHSHSF
ncbi:ZIP family metal transporter [Mycoplasma sp. Mirounga ES2805-ORL]|uniref:ZIP family metal transporter n=1 Tax=Mycoplasma sp. Mirounga ES2805-ORL TaxID=754514 RepID=UPI00197B777B|nr:ZIP family metal transporter [Mycoplasma sp. Mirounga ES2805-ORL]QSF13843.1 ZIP family metal transporter [Mycoplasma sp. Mirounga ES2805-ORL]